MITLHLPTPSIKRYSPNPAINETIAKLLDLRCPPLPVAPKQDGRKEWCHHVEKVIKKFRPDKPETVFIDGERVIIFGDYCKISFTGCGNDKAPIKGDFVRIGEDQKPSSLFTGKNPSFLDKDGRPRKLQHGEFQKRLPTDQELYNWFANPNNGIGTLGGHGDISWIDFDAKNYSSQEECDRDVLRIINNIGQETWTERTGSGGWRLAVKLTEKPSFTNFSTSTNGDHVGEALSEGRFTVLAPTVHPNGNQYRRINNANPATVDRLESIGIYPAKDEIQSIARKRKREYKKAIDPTYGQPTNPANDPEDFRNIAPYFDGYTERGDWGYAKCPHHNGNSLTSFRVYLLTGAPKLWCNCDVKAVKISGLQLAISRGHKLPEKRDRKLPGEISREDWQKSLGKSHQGETDKKISQELWEWLHGIPGLFKKEFAKIKRKLSGSDREKQKNLLQSEVDYVFTELQSRSELVANLLQDGKKIIHFGCHGGQGKTHFVAFLLEKLKEINYECDRVAYGAKSGRNAPTPELEANFRVLTICHNGLAEDPHRKTPLGYPVYVHPTPDNPAVTDGNCHLTAKRQRLIELGYDIHGILACQLLDCKLIDYCGKESGRGYGFRHERKLDLASPRISLNPESLPDELDFLEGTILVLDELGQLKTGVKDFELGLEDISAMQSYILMNNAPELVRLLEALTALQVFASDDDNLPFYGCDVKQIRTSLNIPESQHEEIVNAAKIIDAKLHREVSGRNLHKAPKVWLTKFFTILFNQQNGFLKINKKELRKGDNTTKPTNITITTIDDRFRLILEQVKAVVILDGTSTKESLSRLMGVDKEEIYSVAQIRPQYNNQKIIRIRGLGNCGGNNPSDSMIKRMNAIEGKVKQLHGENIPILKRTKHSNYEQWWVDSRAQNRDAGVPVRLSFGTPYQNLSALQAQLTTLTGEYHELGEANQRDKTSPELQAEIDFQTLMEFLQDLWRQRAHRYPDREFIQYYVTDFDLSPLTEICPGLQYEEIDAFAFTPEAGDDKQQTKWRITQAIKEKLEAGVEVGKIRQKDILAKAEIGIDWLKKICQGFGGWQQLKKGVAALLKFCSSNTPLDEDQLTEEEQWFLKTWLPLQAKEIKEANISAVLDVGVYVATYGIKAFEKLCRFLDPSIRADILAGILSILPTNQLEQLLEESIT